MGKVIDVKSDPELASVGEQYLEKADALLKFIKVVSTDPNNNKRDMAFYKKIGE